MSCLRTRLGIPPLYGHKLGTLCKANVVIHTDTLSRILKPSGTMRHGVHQASTPPASPRCYHLPWRWHTFESWLCNTRNAMWAREAHSVSTKGKGGLSIMSRSRDYLYGLQKRRKDTAAGVSVGPRPPHSAVRPGLEVCLGKSTSHRCRCYPRYLLHNHKLVKNYMAFMTVLYALP